MPILDEVQTSRALKALDAYLKAPPSKETLKTPLEESAELDEKRISLIAKRLLPVLTQFLNGQLPLSEFKPEVDRINKQNELWGFKGVKGQMFFNLIYNACLDENELVAELISALPAPPDENSAKSRIRNFASYVRRIGDDHVANGNSKASRPKPSSIPFFLSYFWQIQAPDKWPVFFTNSVRALSDLNLYQTADDLADAYIDFARLHAELQQLFSNRLKKAFSLYDVEHVWWNVGQEKQLALPISASAAEVKSLDVPPTASIDHLPDSYVPPIINIIPLLASNDGTLELAAKASGTSVPRALEKSVHAAFTILGYETQLLGQGQGRIQDGLALANDYSYAILWDSKARQNGYSMGTDDRTIREYITTQSREIKRRRHLRNLYYVLVSSGFNDEFDDLIRGLKMETEVSEVILVEAEALVVMVDAKLRDPNQLTLGPDGLQRIFSRSGLLTAQDVKEELGLV
ncbi:hypothetical protein [Propionivibrio dicarboxylicus]|uniref:Uncharacterized protein n=1 Tax=Propionivibrio dicarboxylicus TaxID=83767 RepID=A0A1G8EKW3_9RHOO|nr:hypothetical protein [Propionivibrio dicarboxylicus]SDH70558.1 hypothetical protein SAMN05660652_02116 [Propionivibrio dicarboxylicus]